MDVIGIQFWTLHPAQIILEGAIKESQKVTRLCSPNFWNNCRIDALLRFYISINFCFQIASEDISQCTEHVLSFVLL